MGLALSPHMVATLQWPSVFYVFGFIGVFWFLAWEKNASSSPAVDDKISKEEKEYITSRTISQVLHPAWNAHLACASWHTVWKHMLRQVLLSPTVISYYMGNCGLTSSWQ